MRWAAASVSVLRPWGIVDQLQLPIVLGPMAGGPGTTKLAAAVSEAGGLSFVPAEHGAEVLEAGQLLDVVEPRYWALILTPLLGGTRPEELLALRERDIDAERELIVVHQRAAPGAGDPTSQAFSRLA